MMSYLSDLTDKQWFLIKDYFDQGNYGKSRKYSQRMLINAVFYLLKRAANGAFYRKTTHLGKQFIAFINEQRTKLFGSK